MAAEDKGTQDARAAAVGARRRRFPWVTVLLVSFVLGGAIWNFARAWPVITADDVGFAVIAVLFAFGFFHFEWKFADTQDKFPLTLARLEHLVAHQQQVHLSIHHLFNDRDLLRPRGGGNVDMVLDAADLPPTLTDYLKDVHATGAKARILLLDPSSSLTERHRFVQQAGGDASAAVQHFRAKIDAAIAELGPLATIRLFDALPPGNLIIVDDHIFWGGVPSIPSDAAYPIIGITADTREHVYWAFRRNFDVLWKQAKPVDTQAPRATRSIAAASL